MSQESYINAKVDYMNIEQGGRSSKTELTDKEKIIVRGSMGMFRWVTDQTPPDLAFDNLLMSILQSQATFEAPCQGGGSHLPLGFTQFDNF